MKPGDFTSLRRFFASEPVKPGVLSAIFASDGLKMAKPMIHSTYANQYIQQFHRRPRSESKKPRTFHHQHEAGRGTSLGPLHGWCLVFNPAKLGPTARETL